MPALRQSQLLSLASPRPAKRVMATIFGLMARPASALANGTGPFGTGLPDRGGMAGASYFPKAFAFLVQWQTAFTQDLTKAIENLNHHGTGLVYLLGIALLYGVIHAVGPGHGKAITTSYLLADRQTLRNGIWLAFLAAMVQAVSAITLILIAALALHATSVSITNATYGLELGSDALIAALGLWLVWSRILRPLRSTLALPFVAPAPMAAPVMLATRAPVSQRFQASPTHIASLDDCACGEIHLPSAEMAAGHLDFRKAWSIIATTALRPCTGALIVLVFALSQGVLWAGILATLVMSLGTALSVCTLAALTVTASSSLRWIAGSDSRFTRHLMRTIEALASLSILALGLGLLAYHLQL
ncbi:MAG: hypothetical protein KGQ46_06055 [Hyphomicrobiales bacterium]|nr:hypothetical protein [Hyphomicrobiales bacterium]MDE2115435.1 hypothetical protein [Hyphomicrobiales bacterium]